MFQILHGVLKVLFSSAETWVQSTRCSLFTLVVFLNKLISSLRVSKNYHKVSVM